MKTRSETGSILQLVSPSGVPFRVIVNGSDDPKGACLIVQSGQMGNFDQDCPEKTLYEAIGSRLAYQNIVWVMLDLPLREDLSEPADTMHMRERTQRLQFLLSDWESLELPPLDWICGMSLGAICVIKSLGPEFELPSPPQSVLLMGAVVDAPATIMPNLDRLLLILGERDYIAYLQPGADEIEPVSPQEHGETSFHLLITLPKVKKELHIIEDENHTLVRQLQTGNTKTVDYIAQTIIEAIYSSE